MSIEIDGKDFTKYIERGSSYLGGDLHYKGLGVEDEGKKLESLLEDLPKEVPIRIEDTKFYPHGLSSGIYKIINIKSQWEGALFRFEINLKKV